MSGTSVVTVLIALCVLCFRWYGALLPLIQKSIFVYSENLLVTKNIFCYLFQVLRSGFDLRRFSLFLSLYEPQVRL